MRDAEQRNEESGFYSVYQWHATVLRTWLVAYGIGAPVFLLTQEQAYNKLTTSECSHWIAATFLTGVALQVLLAFVNKTVMWVEYYGRQNPESTEKWYYKAADWTSRLYAIDFICDLLSISLFGWATVKVCSLLLSSNVPCVVS